MNESESTMSTTTEANDSFPLREQAWFKLFLCTLYSVIFIVGVGGNTGVCFIIYQRKKLKTVTNLFILNLAISDLIFSGSIPLELSIILHDYEWPYASFFCKIYSPIQTIAVSVSIFTLTVVSIIRYRGINHPLKRQVSHSQANYIVLAIWIFSVLLMIPYFLSLTIKGSTCSEKWPHESYRKMYTTILFVCFYVLPLIIVVFAYTKIVRELKKKKDYHNAALNEARNKETSKVVSMLIKVTFVFALCNLPSQIMWLWMDFGNAEKIFPDFWNLLTALNIFIFANSAANPVLYYIFHDRFRSEILAYFKKCRSTREQKQCCNRNDICQCNCQPLCLGENAQVGKEIMVKMNDQILNGTSIQLTLKTVETKETCL